MPAGPKGQKRSADAIGNAVKVMQIAIGEELEDCGLERTEKNEAAAEMSRKGAAAWAKKLAPEKRIKIAQHAATTRWKR